MNEQYDWANTDNLYFATITFNFNDPDVGKQIKDLIDWYQELDLDDEISKWWMNLDAQIKIGADDENYIPTIETNAIKIENDKLVWDLTIAGLPYGVDFDRWIINYDEIGLMIANQIGKINWVGQTYYDENVNQIRCGYNLFQNKKLIASAEYEKQLNAINDQIDEIDYLSSEYENFRLQLINQATNDLNKAIRTKIKQRVHQKPQS